MVPWKSSIHHISLGEDSERVWAANVAWTVQDRTCYWWYGKWWQSFWQEQQQCHLSPPFLSPPFPRVSSSWSGFSVKALRFGCCEAISLQWVGSCSLLAKQRSSKWTHKPRLAPVIPEKNVNLNQTVSVECFTHTKKPPPKNPNNPNKENPKPMAIHLYLDCFEHSVYC